MVQFCILANFKNFGHLRASFVSWTRTLYSTVYAHTLDFLVKFFKWAILGLFFFIFLFNTVDSKCPIKIFADDWIRTADLWNWKRLLFQLSHNHCQLFFKVYFINPFSSSNERLPRTPIINTRYGKIQGRIHTLPGQDDLPKVEIYHGIPYATPPVSSNRWEWYLITK